MPEETKTDNRPWWRKRTNYGIALSLLGAVITLTPGAPVVFAIAAVVPVTTTMLGVLLTGIGSALGSYGAAKRADNLSK
jgi:hypothetical protein